MSTSSSVDEIFDLLDERFDSETGFLQLFFMGVEILAKVGTVGEALGEFQR